MPRIELSADRPRYQRLGQTEEAAYLGVERLRETRAALGGLVDVPER